MKHLFVSDTHLNNWIDNSTISPDNTLYFKLFLQDLLEISKKNNNFTLYIVGDFLDVTQSGNVESIILHYQYIFDLIKKLSEYIKIYAIIGNHDTLENENCLNTLNKLLGLNINVVENLILKNIYITHGHTYDPFFNKSEMICNLVDRSIKFYGLIEKLFKNKNTKKDKDKIVVYFNNYIRDNAIKSLREIKLEKIIIGHTHEVVIEKDIINTGSWVNGNADIILFNENTNNFKYINYIKDGIKGELL